MTITDDGVPRSAFCDLRLSTVRIESEARDRAQFILGAVSLVIWLLAAFTLSVLWFVDEYTGRPILTAGGIAFLVAALPWLAYRPLVRHFTTRRGTR